jgi:hypothetical protein
VSLANRIQKRAAHSGKRVVTNSHSFEISTILPRGAALTLPRRRFIYSLGSELNNYFSAPPIVLHFQPPASCGNVIYRALLFTSQIFAFCVKRGSDTQKGF